MSASTHTPVPVFDGSDSADAEDFIAAIRVKAFSEGKQRDQAWILDLVSANLRRDALRWHAALDPAIQNDWGLLQKAILARFCETFQGIDGVECERFIHSIRRRTFEEGKAGDNEWITQFLASCVVDDALRWHLDLAPEIQNDWALLQKAMVARYPPPEVRDRRVKSPIIPMPASAAPAPSTLKTGLIRLADPTSPSVKTYLTNTLHTEGHLLATQNRSDALIVEYDPFGESNTLRMKNFPGAYDLLGIGWYYSGAPDLSATSNGFARLVGISRPPSGVTTASYTPNGTLHADVWDISSDGTVKMVWTDANGAKVPLAPRFSPSNKGMMFIAGERSGNDSNGSVWTRANFVFEAI